MSNCRNVILATVAALCCTVAQAGIFAGTNAVSAVYYGTQAVSAVYSGTSLVWSAVTEPSDVLDGLAVRWQMSEGTGSAVADSSGNGNTLTLGSGVEWTTRENGGGALRFPMTGDSFATSANAITENFAGWTFCAWVQPVVAAGGQYFKDSYGDARSLVYGYTTSAFNMYNEGWPTGTQSDTSAAGTTGWQHVLYTSDGSRLRVYINGVKIVDTAVDLTTKSGTARVCLGGYWLPTVPTPNFNGYLDEVRFYSRAVTDADATVIYNTTR